MNETKIIFISIIVILLSSMSVLASDENQILLKSSCIDTDTVSIQNETIQYKTKTTSMPQFIEGGAKYYIVQFEGPIIQEWKVEVQTIGADFFDYIPNNAFVLRMNETEKRLVESLEFVHWTGDYLPEYKYRSEIVNSSDKGAGSDPQDMIDLIVFVFDPDEVPRIESDILAIDGSILERSDILLGVRIQRKTIDKLSLISGISWIEQYAGPSLSNDVAAGISNVDTVRNTLDLKGSGQIVAVCDTGLDTGVNDNSMHADIRGRILSITDLSGDGAEDISGHGTHVAGSVLGNGEMSGGQYAGIAPEAQLVFQAVGNDSDYLYLPGNLSEVFQPAYNLGARIHTNSWGVDSSGEYDSRSYYVDHFAWNNPDMLILFSSGNEGVDLDSDGVVDPDSLNSPGTAKNCITVGASESYRGDTFSIGNYSTWGTRWPKRFNENPLKDDYIADNPNGIAAFSSRGPTDDGRIKPDLVAPGTFIISTKSSRASWYDWGVPKNEDDEYDEYYAYFGGSSMSTPIVAGSAALVREYYAEIEKVTNPSAALIKATLLNGAYDMTPGQYGEGTTQDINGRPDYSQGWGRLDVDNSIQPEYPAVIAYFDYVPMNSTSDSWEHTYEYVKSGQPMRSMLVWTDYPAAPAASKALVNDLDLIITGPSKTYYGNDGPDRTNNVEGIEIEKVAEGDYTITVEAYNILHAPQDFALVSAFTCDNNEYPANGSYAQNSTAVVSADIVHPAGVDKDSINLDINDIDVVFDTTSIPGGYRVWYDTSVPFQSGVNNVSFTALTNKGQEFTYAWTFSTRPEINSFRFDGLSPQVVGTVDEGTKTITLTVPYGTDLSSLVPTIMHTGAKIAPNAGLAQDFTSQVVYTVTAEDSSIQEYTVTVNIAPSTAKAITSFDFEALSVTGTVDEGAKTVDLTVPFSTDVTALTPTIVHTGASVSPDIGVAQDFTNTVTYTVTAADASTQEYVVTVTVAAHPAKAITSFDFEALSVTGTVDEGAKTVVLTVPFGTDVTALTPTIVHTGASISPNTGLAQNFTNQVVYTVTAQDNSIQEYTVTVNVAPNTAKEITSFDFDGLSPQVVGIVDEGTKTVTLTVPYGTDLSALVPTIMHTGAKIAPNAGLAQNFASPVAYTVTAEDASNQEYTVTVDIAPNTAKEITSFNFAEIDPAVFGTINESLKTVILKVPHGTNVSALIPTIMHTGANITPNSGLAQNFASPVTYTVTAEDDSYQQYTVTVNIIPNTAKEITSFNFDGLSPQVVGMVDEGTKMVTLTVPYGTDLSSLIPTIMHTGANITPNSGFTPDFTNPVTYTVTAEDKTDQKYTVTVNVAPNTAKEITSFDFAEIDPAVNGSINESLKTITLKVPHGTNVTALVPTIVHSGTNISPNTGVAQNFTNPVIYTVTDANSSTQNYTVSVIIAANTDNNPPATPTNSGGGGGGGGGTTGEAYENIEVKDVSSMFVNKDMSARFEFKNENNDIQYVEYDSLKNAGSISVTIECLKDRSTFADSLPAGKIYRNVNIWVGKTGYATPNNIVEPMIGFRVNNSWIENNNINVNSIVLNRYDGSWNKLPTAQTSFDNSYHYFETSTPGFSPFVITGDSLGSEENLNDGTENLLSTQDASLSELNSSIVNETQPENVLSALSGLISCLIISFVCFLVRKQ